MTHLALRDELLDAQLLRTVGACPYGGADLGECLVAAAKVRGTDLDSWYDAWRRLGAETLERGEAEVSAGHIESARGCFFRACSYFRNAGVMLMGPPLDSRLIESNRRQTDAFRKGAALLARPPELLDIPFENTTLPGYFFRAGSGRRATAILLGGYDGTAEELYFFNGAAALARGYNVLMFEGPGQGAALIQQGLIMRPDYETVVGAVLDYLLQRPEVDPTRAALIGLSLGGHLAPRAASGDHRIAALIAIAAPSTSTPARWTGCRARWRTVFARATNSR